MVEGKKKLTATFYSGEIENTQKTLTLFLENPGDEPTHLAC